MNERNPSTNGTINAQPGEPDIMQRVLAGEILRVPGFCEAAGIWQLARTCVIEAAGTIDASVAERLDREGFDHLHSMLGTDDTIELLARTDRNLLRHAVQLYRRVIAGGLRHQSPVWVLREPIIRFHVPFDNVSESRRAIAVSYTHLTLPTTLPRCRSRWSPYQ